MQWACTDRIIPIAHVMLGIMDGLRWLPVEISAELVWRKPWATVPMYMYWEFPYFWARYRGCMGYWELERQYGTSRENTARFLSSHHAGYKSMSVPDRDGPLFAGPSRRAMHGKHRLCCLRHHLRWCTTIWPDN